MQLYEAWYECAQYDRLDFNKLKRWFKNCQILKIKQNAHSFILQFFLL